jgi:rubrerythrin
LIYRKKTINGSRLIVKHDQHRAVFEIDVQKVEWIRTVAGKRGRSASIIRHPGVVGDDSPFGRWAITGIIERGDMFNLRDVLDMAIQIERNGEAVYRRALTRTEDPELIEMLTWMAGEESRHAGHFSDIRQRMAMEGDNILMDELGTLMLESIVGNRSFSLEDVDFSKIEEVHDLLKIMIRFEKDTVGFYYLFRDFLTDGEEKACLDGIIADEEQHIRKLEECRDKDLACHRL